MGWEVESIIGRQTDLVVLNDAPPRLQHQVLKHGRRIFERDRAARVEFEVRGQNLRRPETDVRLFQSGVVTGDSGGGPWGTPTT